MQQMIKYIDAPQIDSSQLWNMTAEDFNMWRRKNDYPRIIAFLKNKLPQFEDWMSIQKVSDDILIEQSPSKFLKQEKKIFLYDILDKDQQPKRILATTEHSIGETFFHNNTVKTKQSIIPYSTWYKKQPAFKPLLLTASLKMGNKAYFMSELEIINLGSIDIFPQFISGSWDLDFVNLDNLKIKQLNSNCNYRIWFSSAENLTIDGDLYFLDAYSTSFYSVVNPKYSNLKLLNGSFQSWSFENCSLHINALNCIIHNWRFKGYDFNATLINSEIINSEFLNHEIVYPQDYERAKNFHAHIKRLFSQIGKRNEASKHFYLEKQFERKSFLRIRPNFRDEYKLYKEKSLLPILYLKFYIKYIYSLFNNILWGYGEKPARVFLISISSILLFSLIFSFHPNSNPVTHLNFANSLYYSMVTFATLGYGDISQTDILLKLLSGFEAILGMSLWGILIAGFTSNSKDY